MKDTKYICIFVTKLKCVFVLGRCLHLHERQVREKVMRIKIKQKTHGESHSENRSSFFRCLQNAAKESTHLIFLWWGTQSLGVELEKPLKPNWVFLVCFLGALVKPS